MTRLRSLFDLFRAGHWIKNLFLFIPIFFAGELQYFDKLKSVLLAFFAFSLVASAVYVINDVMDIEDDRRHPTKSKRPLASGFLSVNAAWIAFVVLLSGGILFSWMTESFLFGLILVSYFLINIGYSLGLKKVPIVEILIVSSGFVLRVIAGGFVADVRVSQWMVMMIFLLALFLALAKRRDDFFVLRDSDNAIRKSIEYYNLEYINALLIMVSGIIIVAYLMYVISPEVIERFHSRYLYVTSIFVIAGMMRYLQITLVENKSGSPTKILYQDNFIRIVLILWMLTFYFIIYYRIGS
jgi:decaprenyl-phosphate phosphoribosyltransferase